MSWEPEKQQHDLIIDQLKVLNEAFIASRCKTNSPLRPKADKLLVELQQLQLPAETRYSLSIQLIALNPLLFTKGSAAVREFLKP